MTKEIKTIGDGTAMFFLHNVYKTHRQLKPDSFAQLEVAVRRFEKWYGPPLRLVDLSAEKINTYLEANPFGWVKRTAKTHRTGLRSIWQLAHDLGYHPEKPENLRRIRVAKPVPRAWTMEEVKQLLKGAGQLEGCTKYGLAWRLFFKALIRVGYDTGLRKCDLLNLKRSDIANDGTLAVTMEKTGQPHVSRLRPETLEAIEMTIPPYREAIFEWPYCRQTFWWHWGKLLDAAEMPKGSREGLQKLRRTSASHLEAVSPGSAGKHLGHLTHGLAEAHYVDPKIARPDIPQPPSIDESKGGE